MHYLLTFPPLSRIPRSTTRPGPWRCLATEHTEDTGTILILEVEADWRWAMEEEEEEDTNTGLNINNSIISISSQVVTIDHGEC